MRSTDLIDATTALPRHEAERLLAVATGKSRSHLVLGIDIDSVERSRYDALVARRLTHEPLQYIEGSVPFGRAEIAVDDRVLIPRPETELMFEIVSGRVAVPSIIVDLCTGSGNLAIALKAHYPNAAVYATDISPDAIVVARQNAVANAVDVEFCEGNLFDPLPSALVGAVDLLVANPPYLSVDEVASLPADVLREPRGALVAGPTGDELVTDIAAGLGRWLAPDGAFAVEVSEYHAARVLRYFSEFDATVAQDLTGRNRYVLSRSLVG